MLKAQWINDNQIAILKGNKVVAAPSVRIRENRSSYLKTRGNHKTKNMVGLIKNVAQGCFRKATEFEKCDVPCYEACYANETVYARKNTWSGFNIIHNGMDNQYFHINIPASKNYKLNTLKIWRIDSETSDMSLGLALGLAEPWIEANQDKFFTGISSDYFFVPAKELKKLAQYDNLVVGHTISIWFGEDDLENRFEQIERYCDYGVNTMVWVVTKPEWVELRKDYRKQQAMVKRALKLVDKTQIIEVPFHYRQKHEIETLGINPHGSCCETGKCIDCKVLCGVRHLVDKRRK